MLIQFIRPQRSQGESRPTSPLALAAPAWVDDWAYLSTLWHLC
jgi:hypothetical protein